ncbi:ABC transporter substrate-binding protein [Paenibacillus whitsoniae]|uniref:Extracellular solute-binding protein n=1 Tax=Paenibacillus whitsoniae TaxID=2496558 RepID=A0A430JJK8_9BACL|nr:ABC transporter substrate-binding protein [Paenibacillus whitsoniae]RTE11245.1 extracellular solute-binding protein [Paenibacillus whitsoniae]
MKGKKIGGIALAIGLSATVVLSGCQTTQTTADASKQPASTASNEVVNPPGVLPITKEKTTLKVMSRTSPNVENFATNEFTKWLEEKTNIHIEWDVATDPKQKLNISMASGDYPDVYLGFNIDPVQLSLYGKDGVFIPLNKLIDKYGVETKKMFAALPYTKELSTAADGNIYGMPSVNECFHCMHSTKLWINQKWLDALGLKMPTTTDEFYEVLKAFKTKDPNGNKKADELPFVGANIANSYIDTFLMEAFIDSDRNMQFLKDGKITAAYTQPEYKEGLKYINKLFKEGLIDPQSLTQDRNQLRKLGENPDAEILGVIAAQNPTVFNTQDGTRWKDYVAVPPLKGPKGVQASKYIPQGITTGSFVITNKAKNPEIALRLADFLYTEEATNRAVLGRPDLEWKTAGPNDIGINGKPAKYSVLGTSAPGAKNATWGQVGPSLRTNEWRLGQTADPKNPLEDILYKETLTKYEPYKPDPKKIIPTLNFTNEQTDEIANISKTIEDYRKETTARMIIGDMDIDKKWDEYLKNLDNMKLPRYLQIYQTAFDALKK